MNRIKYLFLATLSFVLSSCDKGDEPPFVPTLEFGMELLSVDAAGGLMSVDVRADMPYEIVIPHDVDWVRLVDDTQEAQSGVASATLSFEVGKNMEGTSRTAEVVIQAIQGLPADTLRISQSGLSDETDITAEFNPDFFAILQQKGYIDNINYITYADVKYITELDVMGAELTSLKGIEYFSALTVLFCDDNQLTSLDMSYNTALEYLFCSQNQLTSLNISRNAALETLECNDNQLTSLDVSQNIGLEMLNCFRNKLTSLDISHNVAITHLACSENQLKNLDISQNIILTSLWCDKNQLALLDLSHNIELGYLECQDNYLVNLDLSKNTSLWGLYCETNPGNKGIFEVVLWKGSKLKAHTESWIYDGQTVKVKYLGK